MAKTTEVHDFMCEVFEPKTAEMNGRALRGMLNRLYSYYPHVKKPDGSRELYDTGNDHSKKWFKCYDHLLMLLDMRKQQQKYWVSIGLSIFAVAVSIVGVVVRIFWSG